MNTLFDKGSQIIASLPYRQLMKHIQILSGSRVFFTAVQAAYEVVRVGRNGFRYFTAVQAAYEKLKAHKRR